MIRMTRGWSIETVRVHLGHAHDSLRYFEAGTDAHTVALDIKMTLERDIDLFFAEAVGKDALMEMWCSEMHTRYCTYAKRLFYTSEWEAGQMLSMYPLDPTAYNAVKYNNIYLMVDKNE